MKSIFIIIGLIVLLSLDSKAQLLSTDTVVCIIDTTKCYVKYRENPIVDGNSEFHWQVSIQGHYYDIEWPQKKDFACIVFRNINLSEYFPYQVGPWDIKMHKGKIKDRFIVENDKWINLQKDYRTLNTRIGFYPRHKCNFIVWKQDFDNVKTDLVTMHRVTVGYYEIQD